MKNEIDTLKTIANTPTFYEVQRQLCFSANDSYKRYALKGYTNLAFSFSSWIEFPRSASVKKASIECRITCKPGDPNAYDILTYSFGLFRLSRRKKERLIKKFHIDFISTPDAGSLPLQPVFHLQSPGELSPMLRENGTRDDHLDPWLSEPRLCCAPTTIALLADLLLREFGGDQFSPLRKLTRELFWRHLIKRDEELVLKPYFKACCQFFNDRANKKPPEHGQFFSQDFVYGKS